VVAALAAAAAPARRRELIAEGSDLLFHLLVLLADRGVPPGDLAAELARRHFAAAPTEPGAAEPGLTALATTASAAPAASATPPPPPPAPRPAPPPRPPPAAPPPVPVPPPPPAAAGARRATPHVRELLADSLTPLAAYRRLAAEMPGCRFLFESVTGGERVSRFSFLGAGPSEVYRLYPDRLEVERDGRRTALPGSPLAALRAAAGAITAAPRPVPLPRGPA